MLLEFSHVTIIFTPLCCLAELRRTLAEAYSLYLAFVLVLPGNQSASQVMQSCMLACWGLPFVLVLVARVSRHTDYLASDVCWLSTDNGLLTYSFVLPILLVAGFNLLFYVAIIHRVWLAGGIHVAVKVRTTSAHRHHLFDQPTHRFPYTRLETSCCYARSEYSTFSTYPSPLSH